MAGGGPYWGYVEDHPLIATLLYGYVMYRFSIWRTRRTLARQSTPLDDVELKRALRPLADVLEVPAITVQVYEITPINGLATAHGGIYITRGFIDLFKAGKVSAAEMASVVAHELGHVALAHTRRRMIDFSGQNAVRVLLTTVLGRLVPWGGVFVAGLLTRLLAAKLSRSDEFEADAYATALMMKAGYGADPQISLFEKLDHLTGAGGGGGPAWLLSHPKAADRIAAIQRNVTKWSG